jgi:uncharacterized protein
LTVRAKISLDGIISVHTINSMKITFDPAKDDANIAKHGVSLALVADLDWDAALVWTDGRRNYGEVRQSALAVLADRVYFVAFVDRADERRVISLRKANLREVKSYAAND